MRPRPLFLAPLLAAVAVGLAAGSTADGQGIPRAASYKATLDVSGYVRVRATEDTTGVCLDGRDVVTEYVGEVDMGAPRRVDVVVAGGATFSSFATRARAAVHEGRVIDYRETDQCPSNGPLRPGEPTCLKRRGTLRATLTPTPLSDREEDLAPLVRGVSISVQRRGGGDQDRECSGPLGRLEPRIDTSVVNTLELAGQSVVVPLGVTDRTFLRLRRGRSIRRQVTFRGACTDIQLSSGPALGAGAAAPSSCTVSGRLYVAVKRVG